MKRPIAITMGDPAGIGPEIVARLWMQAPEEVRTCAVVGDIPTLRRAAAWIAHAAGQTPWAVAHITSFAELVNTPSRCIPVIQACTLAEMPTPGVAHPQAGKAAADSVVWAADAALKGECAAVVTAPMNKWALHQAGGAYAHLQGHTELLQARAATFYKQAVSDIPVRMMLTNEELSVVLVSIHVSLRQAIAAITVDSVLETLRITHQHAPGPHRPRIAVAGLNPHAGEEGLFGHEEKDILTPAIEQARVEGMDVHGPFSPDTVFMRARSTAHKHGEFDVVVAMYHDQGLIPIKYLGIDQGVNVTLGLPFVRTSPDHGTAYDIAGQGTADCSSLRYALRWAREHSHR